MKKLQPYLIGAIAFIVLAGLLIGCSKNQSKKLDERITLRGKDKLPYGCYIAYNLLPALFPGAEISTDKQQPPYWNNLSPSSSNQAVIIVAKDLNASRDELTELLNFARKGNQVFIISRTLSYSATSFFVFNGEEILDDNGFLNDHEDSLAVQLSSPRFEHSRNYIYPGRRFAGFLNGTDSRRVVILGMNAEGRPNFIQFKAGKGNIFLHLAPLAFSNYFILHKQNFHYFRKALSVIPKGVSKLVWNEYFLVKPVYNKRQRDPNWLGVLFQYPAFKWALLTVIATLLLFVLLEMRRKQRIIPVINKPGNESLDFVKTIGRLYYDRKDHKNLARKMSVYFLDHVRNNYKLATQTLDETFVNTLHAKSGYPPHEIEKITTFISALDIANVTEHQLAGFYNQLEAFYENT
ncbi:MAG: DUF4350 domain-containing protein [Chitinophagaceae bacterium]